ncbi:hypothetical protein MBLNU457_3467t1 [Dothideomycetes sp. NU457]
MNDSTKDTAVPDADVKAGPDPSVTIENTSKSTSPSRQTDTASATSPRPISSDRPALENSPTKKEATQNGENDAQDDSEAETVLTSPVKRREALKKANGIKEEETDHTSVKVAVKGTQPEDTPRDSPGNPREAKSAYATVRLKQERQAAHHDQNGDGDTSEMSSVRSLSEELDSEASDGPTKSKRERATDSQHNPRKRKHRESSAGQKRHSLEPPRRKRRAEAQSDDDDSNDNTSDDASPPHRPKNHRRTASAQTNHYEDSPEADASNRTNGRSRRAASHFPLRESIKTSRTQWESDTSSETSHNMKYPQNRLTRSIGRSVSTPGRPAGRDHKRHVNKYGFTRLAEACENGDLDAVREWREKDPEQLKQPEFAGNTPLQVASLNGYPEIVEYLLEQGCDPHCANGDKDTPLIDAAENGHIEVVNLLLKAGVDPTWQNRKGQQAMDVISEDAEEGPELRAILRDAIEKWKGEGRVAEIQRERQREEEARNHSRPGPKHGLHFMPLTPDNLLKLVADNNKAGVAEFLEAKVPVDNNIVAAGAKTGDIYLLNMLLAEMSPKKARSKAEKPMLAVLGTSHFEVVKALTELDQFNPTWRSKANGMTFYQYAEQRQGPHWQQERELLHRLYSEAGSKNRLSSSPVHRLENGSRRPRSPARSKDSDAEMDDPDSPELARTKRRLVPKKDMRATSRRRSPSDSSQAASSPEPLRKPPQFASTHADNEQKPRRKPGRPRTKSLSQATESKPKSTKSSSTLDRSDMFDSPHNSVKRRKSTVQQELIEEEADKENDESTAMDLDNTKQEADKADKLKAADQAQKEAQAEALRKEKEEASKRAEAERLAREKEAAEEHRRQMEQEMAKLPSALRHVLTADLTPRQKAEYIMHHFTPIQAAKGSEVTADPLLARTPMMLTYQAAGILAGLQAHHLLQLPSPPSSGPEADWSLFESTTFLPATTDDRIALHTVLNSSKFVHDLDSIRNRTEKEPFEDMCARNNATRAAISAERTRFNTFASNRWIPVRAVLEAKMALKNKSGYEHLSHLGKLFVRYDACMDPVNFGKEDPNRPRADDVEDTMTADGDGEVLGNYNMGISGITKVEVVIARG